MGYVSRESGNVYAAIGRYCWRPELNYVSYLDLLLREVRNQPVIERLAFLIQCNRATDFSDVQVTCTDYSQFGLTILLVR